MMTAEENKIVVSRYFNEFHDGREHEILEEIMTPDLLQGTRHVTELLLSAFPDYQITIEEQIAEGEKVATVWTGMGTHEGNWESPAGTIAPTGKRVRWTGTTTLRLSEGRISEVIATSWDHLGILQQLEAVDVTEPRSSEALPVAHRTSENNPFPRTPVNRTCSCHLQAEYRQFLM
jgi:predicted ester cyclase